ncbi:hypothetical protein HK103_007279 [Boothiomyces macroporosus]|uniref:Prolyl endopeptidase n=1 Tax=Boothiomyces macroporosus TaxID=261099 RepID=A0AAD5UCC5_9FUNG|nr:hypothetical protein HK103_007279 [Boothiomyces macroporosus]
MTIDFPLAKRVEYQNEYHGRVYPDYYHWLRNESPATNPDIMEYIKAENEYYDSYFSDKQQLIEKLKSESQALSNGQGIPGALHHVEPFYYYWRKEEGKKRWYYCRKYGLEAEEQIILDMNEYDSEYVGLHTTAVSPDQNVLAFSVDFKGDERYKVLFKDLKTMRMMDEYSIPECSGSIVWGMDNQTVFYVKKDQKQRPCSVYRRSFGLEEVKIFHEADESFRVYLQQSISKEYLFVVTYSTSTKEWSFVNLSESSDDLKLVLKRSTGHIYSVEHQGTQFIITTNGTGKFRNNRLCVCPISNTGIETWKEFAPYNPHTRLIDVIAFKNHVVTIERCNGQNLFRVYEYNSDNGHLSEPQTIEFSESFDELSYHSEEFSIRVESPISPPKLLSYNMNRKSLTVIKETVLNNFDPSRYTSEIIKVPIPKEHQVNIDDCPLPTVVPIAVVYRKDLFKRDGSNPAVLRGYGAYGAITSTSKLTLEFRWDPSCISLLDRGFVLGAAFVRGGGDASNEWWDAGRLEHKRNSFLDFISCAKYLFELKITSPSKLAIRGASAGGLLVGTVLNMEPTICKSAILQVPFVDALNTMMDASIPLTVNEYEEWGNPQKKEIFDYISSYSPYDNIPTGDQFPNVLVTTSLTDKRVNYWEPMKYMAKLRHEQHGNSVFLASCKSVAGHKGTNAQDESIINAYLISTLQ